MSEVRSRSRRVALVVEDDPLIQDALKLALVEKAGFQVLTASAPELALPLLEAAAPEVLLLDLGLPGQSGWSVLAALRHHPQYRTLPVLIVTAHREAVPRVATLQDAWMDLLLKPFALETLLERVEALIQHHRTWQTEAGASQDTMIRHRSLLRAPVSKARQTRAGQGRARRARGAAVNSAVASSVLRWAGSWTHGTRSSCWSHSRGQVWWRIVWSACAGRSHQCACA